MYLPTRLELPKLPAGGGTRTGLGNKGFPAHTHVASSLGRSSETRRAGPPPHPESASPTIRPVSAIQAGAGCNAAQGSAAPAEGGRTAEDSTWLVSLMSDHPPATVVNLTNGQPLCLLSVLSLTTMSSTSTATQTRTRRDVLKDYELHHSAASPSSANTTTSPADARPQSTSPVNPPNWDTTHRRVPPYRPINYDRDQSEVRVYNNGAEQVFIGVMFTGVYINSVSWACSHRGTNLV